MARTTTFHGVTLVDVDGEPVAIAASDALVAAGPGTAAAASRVTLASDDPLLPLAGAVTETAPATDTASSGLNGRLQRIAQRLAPITGAAAITPSNTVPVTAGRQFVINCTVAGDVKVKFSDDSTLIIAVAIGTLVLDWAVIQVYVTLTTATATYANLT
jgi:hypothetical protein